MLFDLRGRGRKNTVRTIYILLAFLMGGGLVLFGIGGATSGGLVDAITGSGGGGDTGEKRFTKRETAALQRIDRNPRDEAAYIDLIRARISLAGVGDRYDANTNTYTSAGKAELRKAVDAWNRYQALDPKLTDEQARVATQMVGAFTALNDAKGATAAQEIVAQNRDTAGAYSQLAVLAYQAGNTRLGDLAGQKALSKTDKDLRQQLKAQLDQAKAQGAVSQPNSPTQSGG
jgi:hypothetical protein